MNSDKNIVTSSFQIDAPCDVPFTKHISDRAVRYGNRPALIDALTGITYTYDQLWIVIDNFADSLWGMGFRKGDRICLYMSNCIEFVIAYFGILWIGCVIVAVNPLCTVYELEYYLTNAEPVCMIAAPEVLKTVQQVCQNYKSFKKIIVIDNEQSAYISFQSMLTSIDSVKQTSHKSPRPAIDPKKDVASICYSSGTTGLPKGCIHTHYNFVVSSMQMTHAGVNFLKDGTDVLIAAIPLYHVYGQLNFFGLGLYMGATVVILPRFKIDVYMQCVHNYRATVLVLAPPALSQIVSSPLTESLDLSSVRHVVNGASTLNSKLVSGLRRKLPQCTLLDEYGMTELLTGLCSYTAHNFDDSIRCTGKLLPSVQAMVIDVITGNSLGPNQDGEILFRSPCRIVGYWKNEDLTRSLSSDGWLPSGDIGHYDFNGNFYIVERIKDVLKYNGFQVSPFEVETIILKYPGVYDVAVVGKHDEVAGDLPTAFVVVNEIQPNSGQKIPTAQEIINFVSDKLSPHKKLRGGVYFVKEIPKSPSGKILRRILREMLDKERFNDSQNTLSIKGNVSKL